MSMTRLLGIACLVAAGVLAAWGWDASQSIGSGFSRFFRGTPTDRTLWLYGGAAAAGLAGLVLVLRRPKKKD
jgi:hypothetical protein